ncbi:hypothetical protein [Nocardia sp. NPDC005366]|uniref:hypothetical protein n=1 Tax=Nocardia sp. NPDC005366 TaxID=3156878 RepID=UPI0033BCFF64
MLYENPEAVPAGEPSGAVATATGVLALSGAAVNLIGVGRLGLDFLDDPGRFDNSLACITLLGGFLTAVMLTYGAVLLSRRDETGRFTVIVAAGVWAAIGAIGLVLALIGYEFEYGVHWFTQSGRLAESLFAITGIAGAVTAFLAADWVADLAALILPLLTAFVASSRYTARWVGASRSPGYRLPTR